MKKTLTLIILTQVFSVFSFAQTHIPDKNFANAIRWKCSYCIDGNDNLTIFASNIKDLTASSKGISSLEGIEGLSNLKYLDCSINHLTTLPILPQGLTTFNCSGNKLTTLLKLPQGLTTLSCNSNQLTTLPNLPQSLTKLYCSDNQLITLPSLPQDLTHLGCSSNQLTTLPNLPQSLTVLDCGDNKLTALPNLPQGLTTLRCFSNQLTTLPNLPQSLTTINCDYNQLTTFSTLPNGLKWLYCKNNKINTLPTLPVELGVLMCESNNLTTIPILPQGLTWLDCTKNQLLTLPILPPKLAILYCDDNQLTALSNLPQSLVELKCSKNHNLSCINGVLPTKISKLDISKTNIKCLPNKPIGIANNSLPLCDATNSGTCFAFPKITGNVFLDYNDDGIKNNHDVFVTNQTMEIKPYGYNFTNNQGNYFLFVDTSQALNIKINGISNNFEIKPNERTLKTASSFAQSYDNQDFRLVPKQIIGDMEVSIVSSVQRPGFEGTLTLTYRNIGTTVLFGQIKLEKDPILNYLSAIPKENATNGHTIVWDYKDLKPFETRTITVKVKVPATTPINTKLTNKMFASYNVLNNYYETEKVAEITTVVGSYDPNDKTASVKNLDPQDIIERKPITYTIRFQNTGNYHAERVEIQDTISANFDLSTFKNIAVSHPNCTVSFEKDRFKAGQPTVIKWTFEPIFLPDSTANEPASHGFVRFSIQPIQGLPIGTKLENKAYIYFDYNLPIITNTSTVKVEKTIKVKQIATEIPLKVYPNPSSDRLFVETSEDLNGEFVLTNLLGQVIEYQSNNSTGATVFDLQHLPKGVYILTLKTEEGSVSKKVVKE